MKTVEVGNIRINKYLAERGYCSRRMADRYIADGLIKINGRVAVLGDRVAVADMVEVDDRVVNDQQKCVYLAYHKPVGLVTTCAQGDERSIMHEISYPTRIFPVGRLDKESSGLILLTNDGRLTEKLLHPRYGHEKEYVVRVHRPLTDNFLTTISQGVMLKGKITNSCKIERMNDYGFRIILKEGKNRQIRRMCRALGYMVTKLKRVRIMNISLGDLPTGKYKVLSSSQLRELLLACDL